MERKETLAPPAVSSSPAALAPSGLAPRSALAPSAALAPSVGQGGAALRNAVRALHQKIQAEFTNVGDKFAEEARKIQEGTSEEHNIYGTCTAEEHRELSEDGIDILPLPELPPEH